MEGFPPPENAQVTLANWRNAPFNRWAFCHVSQIVPVAMVWRGDASGTDWPVAAQDISEITFSHAGETVSVAQMLQRTTTDGLVVLNRGRVVHESYSGSLRAHVPHILFSVTKSVVGLVAGIVVERGQLDPETAVSHYLPETAGSGYGDATVRHVLDMTVGVAFDEDYEATQGDMVRYREATGWNVGGDGNSVGLRRYLCTLPPDGEHGRAFKYCSPNTDLLGWILERATGKPVAELLSEALWAPLGAQNDAYIGVDDYGAARTAGGLCVTTRDLARIGQMVLEDGRVDGRQVVPSAWIKDIFEAGDRDAWDAGNFADDMPDTWYRSKWYKHGAVAHAVSGLGIFGQSLFVHPASQTVIAKHSSLPTPLDFECETLQMACFDAIAAQLA